ncbi:MAG: response regulator [Pseudomonadota bacterium]
MTPENQKDRIKELEQAVEQADALAEMKSNFLATMSHEIRTPMQTIYGILELITDEKPNSNIQSLVDTAQGAASGLLEILDDVLDIAKMDADKMELDMFEVPLRTLIYGTLEALAVKVHGVDIDLKADIDEDVPFVVIGDPKRLRQIIMNLTGNAIKFTKQGSVTVKVSTNTQNIKGKDDDVALRFEVIDTGIGMSETIRERLFHSFVQADSSTQREFGGTGLGLSISKKLAELMGGEIGVESEEGTGSTFWFEILTKEVGTDSTTIDLPDLAGVSVIAAEDHPQGGKEIVNSLQSMGAQVELCTTCAEALELVKRRPFDIALVDQGLPDGLGVNLIKDILKIKPMMGIIMYTVRDDAGMQHTLQSLGVKYLSKPASRVGLGGAVKESVPQHKQIDIAGPKKILIAEDTESVRFIFQKQLKKLGVDADFVEDGEDALDAWGTGKYGLLITDLHMPKMDGYEVVKAVRSADSDADKHSPVIVLTADVQMTQRETYLNHGFDECLLKPVSMAQFRGVLIRWGIIEDDVSEASASPEKSANTNEAPEPALDKNAIPAQMGAFDENAIEMLNMFADMTAPLIDELAKAYKEKNYPVLVEEAHSLKGAAKSACCKKLGALAEELQTQAEAGEAEKKMIDEIIEEFARARDEIKTLKL